MKKRISVVIIAYNEEKKIDDCLKSVVWADEIVVVDDGSTDNTVAIAKKYTTNIYHQKNMGYVEPSRNFALSKATGDWILLLDADERVPQTLVPKLQSFAEGELYVCFKVPRKNIIFDLWIQHTGWWPDYNLRFFKKGAVVWSDIIHSQPKVKGAVGEIPIEEQYALIHYNYDSVSQFITKLNSYTTITARERIANGTQFHWKSVIENPFQEFLSRYFARFGYRDGFHGLALSMLMAIYEFVICLKMWEEKKFPIIQSEEVVKEFEKMQKNAAEELHFWHFERKITEEKRIMKKQAYRVRRKLKI